MAREETVRVKVDRTINPSAGLIAPTLKVSSTADGLFVPRESISEAAEKLVVLMVQIKAKQQISEGRVHTKGVAMFSRVKIISQVFVGLLSSWKNSTFQANLHVKDKR